MVFQIAACWWLAGFIAADVVVIGGAAMWPDPPAIPRAQVIVVALEPPPPAPAEEKAVLVAQPLEQTGVASWYGDEWQGRTTASGKPFDEKKLTAAHRTLPLNSRVRVTDLRTGRSVDVTITDRGPYAKGRMIDLSKAAATKLGIVKDGLVPVRIQSLAG
jgi:rare lipoprotein A